MAAHECLSCKGLLKHQTTQLDSAQAVKRGAPQLTRIDYVDKAMAKQFLFITHHVDWATTTIAAIYKDRWQLALFFKAIKQNVKISAFVGTSKKAILT